MLNTFIKRCYDIVDSLLFGGKALPVYSISKNTFIGITYWDDFFNNLNDISKALERHDKFVLLFSLGWSVENKEYFQQVISQIKTACEIIDINESYFLCNSINEQKLISGAGYKSVFCNQNALLDEKKYPITNLPKRYDAVYLARITPFKRHALASGITRLKLIGNHHPRENDYYTQTMSRLAHADYQKNIPSRLVHRSLAESHTGLCLSEEEGAMFVSAEYLLCGIPVVSTPSIGGRDTFFDTRWVLTVDPSPQDIAKAVTELKHSSISPHLIRKETLSKMCIHRRELIRLIQDIYYEQGLAFDFSREWGEAFIHKFGLRCRPSLRFRNRFLRKRNDL